MQQFGMQLHVPTGTNRPTLLVHMHRLQTTSQTTSMIWKTRGITGFYRGYATVIFGTIPARMVRCPYTLAFPLKQSRTKQHTITHICIPSCPTQHTVIVSYYYHRLHCSNTSSSRVLPALSGALHGSCCFGHPATSIRILRPPERMRSASSMPCQQQHVHTEPYPAAARSI